MEPELSEHAILWNPAALGALRRPQLVSLSRKYDIRATGKNTEIVARLTESPSLAPLAPAHTIQPKPSRATLGRGSDAWEVLSDANASLVAPDNIEAEPTGSMRSWKSAGNGKSLGDFALPKSDSSKTVSSLRSLTTSIKRNSLSLLSSRSTSARSLPADDEPMAVQPATGPTVSVAPLPPAPVETLDDAPPSPASAVGIAKRHSTMTLHHRPSTIRLVSPTPSHDADVLPLSSLQGLKQRRSMAPLRSSPGPSRALNRRSMPALSPTASGAFASPGTSRIYPALPEPLTMPVRFGPESSPAPSDASDVAPLPGAFPPLAPTPQPAFVFGQDAASSAQFDDAAQRLMAELAAKTGVGFSAELLKGRDAEVGKLVAVNAEVGTGLGGWGLASTSSAADRYADAHQREFVRMQSLASLGGLPRQPSTSSFAKRKHDSAAPATCPSAPNGAPLVAPDGEGRTAKRTKMSIGASSLARSIMGNIATPRRKTNLRADGAGKRPGLLRRMSPVKGMEGRLAESVRRTQTAVRRASVDLSAAILGRPSTPSKALDDTSRRDRDKARLPIPQFEPVAAAPAAVASGSRPTLASSKSSVALGRPTSTLTASMLSRSTASTASVLAAPSLPRSRSSKTVGPTRPPPPAARTASGASVASGLSALSASSQPRAHEAAAMRKTSRAEVIASARPAPAPPAIVTTSAPSPAARMGALARPTAGPVEQAHDAARRLPALPRSASTLLAPTAASLARMQATAKPVRPLLKAPGAKAAQPSAFTPAAARPAAAAAASPAPSLAVANVYGAASSRDNLFESTFHLAPFPAPPAAAPLLPARQLPVPPAFLTTDPARAPAASAAAAAAGRTPLKLSASSDRVAGPRTPKASKIPVRQASAQRVRARSGGLAGVKSSSDIRAAADMERRRAEIRARRDRMAQEREIREMLG